MFFNINFICTLTCSLNSNIHQIFIQFLGVLLGHAFYYVNSFGLALWFLMHKIPKSVAHSTFYTCIVLADSSIHQTNTFWKHNNQSTRFYVRFNIWICPQLWNRNAIELNFFRLKKMSSNSNEDRKLNFQNSNHSRNNDKHLKIILIICSGM